MSERILPSRAERSLFQTHQWLREHNLTRQTLPIDFWDPKTGIRVCPMDSLLSFPNRISRPTLSDSRKRLSRSTRWYPRPTKRIVTCSGHSTRRGSTLC